LTKINWKPKKDVHVILYTNYAVAVVLKRKTGWRVTTW